MKNLRLLAVCIVLTGAGCASQPDLATREWAARQPGSRTEQAMGRSAALDFQAAQESRHRVLVGDDAWLAQFAAYAASIRSSVAAGDLTEEEGDRLIARQRRYAEAERLSAARHLSGYSYADN